MKLVSITALALVLSACNAHALRHMLKPEPAPAANFSRMQFDCTSGGLFIFEDFPDLKAARSVSTEPGNSFGDSVQTKRNSTNQAEDCLSSLY